MKGIFSVLVENQSGVLSQISGLFARRGFNIDSLAVGETERHDVSRMTIVSTGDERTIEQVEKQLNKNLDVIKVRRLDELTSISLEMLLIKVSYTQTTRSQILEIASITGAKILHMSQKNLILEMHDTPSAIENFVELMRSFGIVELQRTGTIALNKD